MKKSKVLIISLLAVAVVAAVAVPAISRTGRAGRGMGDRLGPVFTDEQREQIEAIHERYEEQRVELANRARVLRMEMHEVIAAEGEPDFAAIERKMEEIAEARLDQAKLRLRIHQDVRPILTDDQRELFDAGIGRALMRGRDDARGGEMRWRDAGRGMGRGKGRGGMSGRGCPWGGRPGMMGEGMPGRMAPMPPDDAEDD